MRHETTESSADHKCCLHLFAECVSALKVSVWAPEMLPVYSPAFGVSIPNSNICFVCIDI